MLAFRLNSHNLAVKQKRSCLLLAAGPCGLQNTPPGSAALALHARVANLTPGDMDNALVKTKALLQAWSLRAAPRVFPTADSHVFTLGLLGTDDHSIRAFISAVEPALAKIGISATDVVELAAAGLLDELDGRSLTNVDLGIRLARRVLPHLTTQQRTAWQSRSWYARGQTLGESIVRIGRRAVRRDVASREKGKRFRVAIDYFGCLSGALRARVQTEAAALAPFKGCASVQVEFTRGS